MLRTIQATDSLFYIHDSEGCFFKYAYSCEHYAEQARATLQESWDRDPLERSKDLTVNFVNSKERCLKVIKRLHPTLEKLLNTCKLKLENAMLMTNLPMDRQLEYKEEAMSLPASVLQSKIGIF